MDKKEILKYTKSGFSFVSVTAPNYYWTDVFIREHRFKYRKSELVKEGYDKNKTELDIMISRGYYRVWNTGNYKYEMNI